ncbi:unnamed protein product [Arctia plantaginis]|uniref:Uncharacterized protein n=1 Tax=Arctia plantaginis TaxID=874455 RepID=A0A8S1B7V0_ARCPL|nr:unnamed protein product [Arctia plantaginis]
MASGNQCPGLGQLLCDFLHVANFNQLNHVTNIRQKILDLVLSDLPYCTVSAAQDSLTKIDPLHPPLEANISIVDSKDLNINSNNRKLNYYKADYEAIRGALSGIDWNSELAECTNVNSMVSIFYAKLNEIINKYVPHKKSGERHYPPWFNKSLTRMLKEKNNIHSRFKKYGNPMDKLEFKLLSKRCSKFAKVCYNQYITDIESKISKNAKNFWSFVKAKRDEKSFYPGLMTDGISVSSDGDGICNLFASMFSQAYDSATSDDKFTLSSGLRTQDLPRYYYLGDILRIK